MAVNYSAYDAHEKLSLSAAGHLWLEMTPVARRGGQPHPGPADDGWKYAFWTWLKDRVRQIRALEYQPKGRQQFDRSLYLEIAKSEEYAALVEILRQLKIRPLFLFPAERSTDTGAPVARGKRASTTALEGLARLIRDDIAPTHLTLSVVRKWLENEADDSEQILDFGDELYEAGIEKLSYAAKDQTLYYTLPRHAERALKLSSFERHIDTVRKEAEGQ